MCFGGNKQKSETPTPAPAPAPPDPVAEQSSITAPRKADDAAKFGTSDVSLRVDRSATAGGVSAGGTGLRM